MDNQTAGELAHTPTPVHFHKLGQDYAVVSSQDTAQILCLTASEQGAEVIVRAINSHDWLLDACKKALKDNRLQIDGSLEVQNLLLVAIAKADGR